MHAPGGADNACRAPAQAPRHIQEEWKHPANLIAGITALAAVVAASIAGWQAALLNRTMRLDQRAWIAIREIHPGTLEAGKNAVFVLKIVDVGRSDALRVVATRDLQLLRRDDPWPPFSGVPEPPMVLFPGVDREMLTVTKEPVGEAQMELLRQGQLAYLIRGRIDYEDIFGERHFTRYCALYLGQGPTLNCSADGSNDAD